jgi:hypothetical protein
MASPPSIDPRVAKTHAALFDTWFPIDELPIPMAIKPDIAPSLYHLDRFPVGLSPSPVDDKMDAARPRL